MRVERSFAFVDLCGFTSYTDVHGDEEAVRVLAAFRSRLREVASRRGVRIAKWLGDGAMLVSVERSLLAEAVLEMEQRLDQASLPLAVRAGMASGEVILFEGDDYIGSPVNLAARLCDTARAHEILATPEVASGLPAWASAEPARAVVVPGFTHPIDVLHLESVEHAADMVTDPVCRMCIPRATAAARRANADGSEDFFCSDACADVWDGTPNRRAPLAAEA